MAPGDQGQLDTLAPSADVPSQSKQMARLDSAPSSTHKGGYDEDNSRARSGHLPSWAKLIKKTLFSDDEVDDKKDEKARDSKRKSSDLWSTLRAARHQRKKTKSRANWYKYTINIAMGLQILLGALVTGLSIVVSPSHVGLTTSILGGISTVVSSYLARMRGTNEPQSSIDRVQELGEFIRKCEACIDDRLSKDDSLDPKIGEYRDEFEDILKGKTRKRKQSDENTNASDTVP